MTGIGNFGYSDLINQALGSRTGKKETQSNEAPGMFGAVIKNINTDDYQALKEKAEAMRDRGERFTSNLLFNIDTDSPKGYTVNKDALNKVRERLREEGIDPSRRTPTHEITDEQMDELAEKYDLEYISACSVGSTEYGNFILDLVYMNVFSVNEVEDMLEVLPFNANNKAIVYYHGDPVTGEGAGYVKKDGSITKDWKDVYTDVVMDHLKTKDPGKNESEYEQMTEDLIAKRLETMMIMESFFARVTENLVNSIDVTKPFIEDASEKLKEDFGEFLT